MTDLQLLIAYPFGILVFYGVIRYAYQAADKAKPETGKKIKKNLRPIIILYSIGMTIQLIYLIEKIFFK
jgi:hypothetical protein